MFVVYIGSILTTVLFLQALFGQGEAPAWFILGVSLWLWFTVLFANFAEAVAEGRSKAQAASLRSARRDIMAKKLDQPRHGANWSKVTGTHACAGATSSWSRPATSCPADGEVIEGVASVDESAITGESAPVIRESGGDFSAVTGGTRVLSDWLIVRVTVNPGEAFLDRMIALVEGARRQKTPNEIALTILLVAYDPDLLPGDRHAAAVLDLQRGGGEGRRARDHHRAGLAPGLPDTDHHRRPAVGHRRRRHGPHDAEERHRDLGPGGRGGGRRGRAAARQDRHHHAGQPPGLGAAAGARDGRDASWPTPPSSPRWRTKRPRAAASSCSRRRSSACASATSRGSARPSCTSAPRRA